VSTQERVERAGRGSRDQRVIVARCFFEAVAHGRSLPWTNGGRGSGASLPPLSLRDSPLSLRDVNRAPPVVAARQGGGAPAGSGTTPE